MKIWSCWTLKKNPNVFSQFFAPFLLPSLGPQCSSLQWACMAPLSSRPGFRCPGMGGVNLTFLLQVRMPKKGLCGLHCTRNLCLEVMSTAWFLMSRWSSRSRTFECAPKHNLVLNQGINLSWFLINLQLEVFLFQWKCFMLVLSC